MLRRILSLLLASAVSIQLVGCSTTQGTKKDPYENLNREIFGFNQTLDKALLRPIAYAYMSYLPQPLQSGVSNFFDNLQEIPTVINDLLQGKVADAVHDTSRFVINSTLGVIGIFDPASSLGLVRHNQDFGQTLYHWGYKNSAFIMLPILGPSTVRDGIGLTTDFLAFSIWPWIESDWVYAFMALDLINTRSKYLRHEKILDVISIDEYLMIRDAYLQHREFRLTGKKDGIEDESASAMGSKVLDSKDETIDDSFFEEEKVDDKHKSKASAPAKEATDLDKSQPISDKVENGSNLEKKSKSDKISDEGNIGKWTTPAHQTLEGQHP